MNRRRTLLLALPSVPLAAVSGRLLAQEPPRARQNIEYRLIEPPQPVETGDRIEVVVRHGRLERCGARRRVELLAPEVALHQVLVRLADRVEQLLAIFRCRSRHLVRDRNRVALARAGAPVTRLVQVRLNKAYLRSMRAWATGSLRS